MKKYLPLMAVCFTLLIATSNADARRVSSDKTPTNTVQDNVTANKKTAELITQLLAETKKTNELLAQLVSKTK